MTSIARTPLAMSPHTRSELAVNGQPPSSCQRIQRPRLRYGAYMIRIPIQAELQIFSHTDEPQSPGSREDRISQREHGLRRDPSRARACRYTPVKAGYRIANRTVSLSQHGPRRRQKSGTPWLVLSAWPWLRPILRRPMCATRNPDLLRRCPATPATMTRPSRSPSLTSDILSACSEGKP